MLKKIIVFILLVASVIFLLFIKCSNSGFHLAAVNNKNNYYYIGEKIIYDVKLGGLYLGKAKFNNLHLTELNSKKASLITFETKITNFHDLEKIYSDPDTLLPFRVERTILGWPISEKIVETYDQRNFTLTVKKLKGKKVIESIIKSDSPIHNAVLLPFFIRGVHKLYIGWSFRINLAGNKYDIKLISIEDIKTPAGKFKAYYFISNPEKFKIWISTDERRIPLKITGFGNFGYTLIMKEYSPSS
jgi:hypothetical protein